MSEFEMIQAKLEEIKTITLLGSKDVFTAEEAALYMGLSKSYVYKLCQSLQIAHYRSKGGKNIYIRKDDITEWMLDSRCKTMDEIKAEAKIRSKQ